MSDSLDRTISIRRATPKRSAWKPLGFLAILVAGVAIFGSYLRYEAEIRWQHAAEAVTTETGERAARLQDWLLRADRTLSWFRPEDIATADRLAVTVRMLHTERFMTPARTLFLVSAAGRPIAGTLPLPDSAAGLSTQSWFKAIQGTPGRTAALRATPCARDPFGSDEGVVLYRTVVDHDAVAGYVGTFLPQAEIAAMARDDDPSNGTITLALQSASGDAFGCRPSDTPRTARPRPGVVQAVLSRLLDAVPPISQHRMVGDDRLVEPGGLHLIAAADVLATMSDDDWRALTWRAGYVAASLLLIMALLSSMLNRQGRTPRPKLQATAANQAADGADWMWELDESGNLVGLAGNAPEHLLPPGGRALAEVAGPIGSSDMRWDRLNAAICAKHAFEGLQVPFQIPGRIGLLTIFELSGQPVLASGGFWGTASLVSEESIARAVPPPMMKAELSVV